MLSIELYTDPRAYGPPDVEDTSGTGKKVIYINIPNAACISKLFRNQIHGLSVTILTQSWL